VNIRQIIKGYIDNALGRNSEMRKDKAGVILHILCCKTTYTSLEASIKIPRSRQDYLVVVKNDTLFKLRKTKYQMQVRHFDLLLLRSVDQLDLNTDENDRIRLSQTMTALSDKASTAERSQLWIRTIIKRHIHTF